MTENRTFIARMAVVLLALASGFGTAHAQVRKSCGTDLVLKLSAGVTTQGSLLEAAVEDGKGLSGITAEWDGRPIPLWSDSEKSSELRGLIGVDLEKPPGRYEWKVSWPRAGDTVASCAVVVTVRSGKFPVERLKVEKQYVQPDPDQQKRAEDDQKKMKAIYDVVTLERYWEGEFRVPLKNVTVGGNFGRRRVLNGQARSPHAGVDFPAAEGTPVFASQAGKVVVAEDLYYSGNTIVIDHGYGIYSLYAHLSEMEVNAGERVTSASEIGKVGATGRVTGPHLHWGLTVDHARVNALQIVKQKP
jgi:murein DD-endopeptidase MepM/ murein hydrolase activator NlpD